VAEQALPVAEALSRSFKAAIALFTGVDSDTGSHAPGEQLPSYTDSTHQKYLTEVEGQLRDKELDVSSDIGHGPAAGAINQKAEKADLIVMSTHGRSGIKRLLIGSVASEVVRRVTKPVLLTRSSNQPARFTGNPPFKRIMVTLDGSEFAERVLPYVKTVARRFNSEVHLLIVPETAETEAIGLKLQHYLEGVAEAFTDIGVATKMHLQGVEPIETIVEVSEQEAIDLIMMATHGRSGLKRIIVGSVADAVVRQAPCPVFLVPIHERGS
jgi:nucleotide-binding universal stress UspA family protein